MIRCSYLPYLRRAAHPIFTPSRLVAEHSELEHPRSYAERLKDIKAPAKLGSHVLFPSMVNVLGQSDPMYDDL